MAWKDLHGTHWRGTAELWLDPLGNHAFVSECTVSGDAEGLAYTWQHEGTTHQGSLVATDVGATFTDTWHSPQPMHCLRMPPSPAWLDVLGSYSGGDGPPWGWRLIVSLRPPFAGTPESLVLQMTNITPWGEEARAVRMVATRA